MIPIPEISAVDMAFGNIANMPKYQDVPDRFKRIQDPYVIVISKWFFRGVTEQDFGKPRPGVDAKKAISALKAIMVSYEPKHEHKEAGCAMLLHEWFELPETQNEGK